MTIVNRILCGIALLMVLAPRVAGAADRTACFEMSIADERTRCATAGESGVRRACDNGNNTNNVGIVLEIWDKEYDGTDGANDNYIGSFLVGGTGQQCITIDWEATAFATGDANPDFYLRSRYEVRKSNNTGPLVKALDTSGASWGFVHWRGDDDADDTFVAKNCQTNGDNCTMYPSGTMLPYADGTTDGGIVMASLDSAQHFLEVYGGLLGSTTITMQFPVTTLAGGNASSHTSFEIGSSDADYGLYGDLIGHELGHILQMQELGLTGLGMDYDKNSDPGHDYNTTEEEWDKTATGEGWACYTGAVSQYDPNVATAPNYKNTLLDTATPHTTPCANNRGLEKQVAKTFWDLDDAQNEVAAGVGSNDDNKNYSSTWIANNWGLFASGTSSNNVNAEKGVNGVNMYDYFDNAGSGTGKAALMAHNCIGDQADAYTSWVP